MNRRRFVLLPLAAAVAGCGPPNAGAWAPEEVVARAAYRGDGPPIIRLYTMVNNRSGAGAHTSLLINASQQVIFDPAGNVEHPGVPERNDVLFGVTTEFERIYRSAHARETHHVVIQTRPVSPEVAEMAFRAVQRAGPVQPAQCTLVTARVLSELPGFESIRPVWFPRQLMEAFGQLPGVTEEKLVEYDDPDKFKAIMSYQGPDLTRSN
ncbi:MAG: hypothetical protein HLUCCA24_02000 [Rhodobacteraceae bacterium HLUCCA24]|nr:MAG: hypothetical protein HLUCCA24_02000 [Rhodobacteraceae bacterium HLUCCA24]